MHWRSVRRHWRTVRRIPCMVRHYRTVHHMRWIVRQDRSDTCNMQMLCCPSHTSLGPTRQHPLSHSNTSPQHPLPLPPSFSHLETRKQRRREREKKGEEKKRRRREGGGRPPPRPPLLEIVGGGLPHALTSPELDKKLFPKPSSSSSSFGGPKVDLPPQASPSRAAAVGDRP